MPRKSSSQWDFGELFETATSVEPAEDTRKVLTVSQLTTHVRQLIENEIGTTWVTGEISNLRIQASGHAYFTLKDENAQLNCVLFRGQTVTGRSALDNGLNVILQGDLTVYEPRGQYQLIVRVLEFQGAGALQIAFEKLKRKLEEAGYFAPERKRPIPDYPQRIGLVTSASGAALRDVLHVIARRHPALRVVLAACRVQGQGAAAEISGQIRNLNTFSAEQAGGTGLDLILVTRGGGSLEDLWAFNEEVVAQAIYDSALPVVSAVGHEIDFTISDFVADLRAATPSAAAELITEGVHSSVEFVASVNQTMAYLARRALTDAGNAYNIALHRLNRSRPLRQVQDQMQRLDDLTESLFRSGRLGASHARQRLDYALGRIQRVRPGEHVRRQRERVDAQVNSLGAALRRELERKVERLERARSKLTVLSPMNTLKRGYSITTDKQSGRIIRRWNQVKPGQRLRTRLGDGSFESKVED